MLVMILVFFPTNLRMYSYSIRSFKNSLKLKEEKKFVKIGIIRGKHSLIK